MEIVLTQEDAHYIGQCPDCHARTFALSVKQRFVHCFTCERRYNLSEAEEEMVRHIFCDLRPDCYPKTITLHAVIDKATAKQQMVSAIKTKQAFFDLLPPHIAPWAEAAEWVELSATEWHFQFPKQSRIAFEYCSDERQQAQLSATASAIAGTPVTVHCSLRR